jgi:hypothetical protein
MGIFKAGRIWPAVALASAVLISAPACATQAYGVRGSYVSADFERRAVDDGYRKGFDEGRDDARHHRSFSLDRHGAYRDSFRNYRGDWERDAYQRGFRRGFESGYRDGFDRDARGNPR